MHRGHAPAEFKRWQWLKFAVRTRLFKAGEHRVDHVVMSNQSKGFRGLIAQVGGRPAVYLATALVALVGVGVAPVVAEASSTVATPTTSAVQPIGSLNYSESVSGVPIPTVPPSGMHQVFADDFDGSALDNQWYSYGGAVSGSGGIDQWSSSQVTVSDGELVLSATKQSSGSWLSGGVSSGPALNETYGAFFVRMKATAAEGVSDVALLWPSEGSGPGETDFVEDGGGAKTWSQASFHYVDNQGVWGWIHSKVTADLTQWHTWGVVVTPNQMTYYLDGAIWAVQTSNYIPIAPRTLDIQTQVWSCSSAAVENGGFETCPDASTPSSTQLDVDWAVAYGFNSAPTPAAVAQVSSVSPASGPKAGGNTVTISGSGFTNATNVYFGATPASSFQVESDDEILAVAPGGSVGSSDVTVETSTGPSAVSPADVYQFVAPTVTSLSPASGLAAGGQTVTITGTDFNGVTKVLFSNSPAESFTVVSPTTIKVVTPSYSVAPVNVTVVAADGTSAVSPADVYHFVAPTVTSLSPASGLAAGGQTVTITGTDFNGVTEVLFSSSPAQSFTVVSPTTIKVVTPSYSVAPVNVTVVAADGTSVVSPADVYHFVAPDVTSLSPASGSAAGGQTVTITGTDFNGVTEVLFSSSPAQSFTVVSPTTIKVVTPSYWVAPVNVTVVAADGTSAVSPADVYQFVASSLTFVAPTVTSLSPASGLAAGGQTVTITGTDFNGVTKVLFSNSPAQSFTVVSPTTIKVVTPSYSVAPVNVTVVAADGTSAVSPADVYHFVAPTVTSLSPASGLAAGGQTVTITGTDFNGVTEVLFSSSPAQSFTVVSPTTIKVVTPSYSVAPVNVTVVAADGTSVVSPADVYHFVAPDVTSLSPASGSAAGGQTVTITGTDFNGVTEVLFSSSPAQSFTVVSPTTIKVVTPSYSVAPVNVTVVAADGTSAVSPADVYHFVA